MTSHLDSHRTTDIKPELLSGVQTGNGTPHDKYNKRGIAHVRTNRKGDIFLQRRLVQNFTFILEWRSFCFPSNKDEKVRLYTTIQAYYTPLCLYSRLSQPADQSWSLGLAEFGK